MSDIVTSVNAASVNAANLTSDILRYTMIGRAKRAPHSGVQSKFRVIYMCQSVGRSVGQSVSVSVVYQNV